MSWTNERIELLRELWKDGLSASRIAGALGGVTRNAVIGKAHRMGLSLREQAKHSERKRPSRNRPKHSYQDGRWANATLAKAPPKPQKRSFVETFGPPPTTPTEPVRLVNDEPTLVAWADLEPHHCRFIPGEPAGEHTRYCGCKTVRGLPYCEAHARRAFAPSQPRYSSSTVLIPAQANGYAKAEAQKFANVAEFTGT